MPRKSSRRKKKKPKFLSLRLNLSPETPTAAAAEEDTIAADFFAAAVDGCAAATLAALFGVESPSAQDSGTPSPSLTHAPYEAQDSGAPSPPLRCARDHIFRTAMRGSEGREREERWVCYEEVTSCDAGVGVVKVHPQGLSLKLDYQEIIDAWCDKGPLYMPGPQTVPDLADHDLLSFGASNGLSDGYISNAAMWTVPENNVREEPEESLKIRHREASVLRYKEKRRNRLFSKRIRYEVRKINAEKRPRMKGRFVKRI